MEGKFNLVLELFYIQKGSRVRRLLSITEYRVQDEITINDPDLKDIKCISAGKDNKFIIPLNGHGDIMSASNKEKFIILGLSKNEAIKLINDIDNEYL